MYIANELCGLFILYDKKEIKLIKQRSKLLRIYSKCSNNINNNYID